jgi:hypothetical protein
MPPITTVTTRLGSTLSQQAKSIIGGRTSKALNTNFASLYDQIDAESVPARPCWHRILRLATSPNRWSATPVSIRFASVA